jgi:hypothetical protein
MAEELAAQKMREAKGSATVSFTAPPSLQLARVDLEKIC